MTDEHADLEAISAYVDGEAPEWADHVAACAECRASAATLRAVAAAVGAPVDAPSAADRDRAIATALTGVAARGQPVSRRHEAERARFARRRPARPWAMPAVAAAVVGILGVSGFVVSSYRTPDETTTLAGPTAESVAKPDTLAQSGGGVGAAAPSLPPGDLGDVPDAATLRARALGPAPAPAATSTGRSNSGAGPTAGDAGALTPTTTLTERAAPAVVGTRPCEEQARTREPTLGPVVYFATARQGQVAGFVLGFRAGGTSAAPVTLLLLAQDGCRELLRAAGP